MSHEGDDKSFLNGQLIHPSNKFFNDKVDLQVHTQHLQQSLHIHCVVHGISDRNLYREPEPRSHQLSYPVMLTKFQTHAHWERVQMP